MTARLLRPTRRAAPLWLTAAALGGIVWNLFGAVQFASSLGVTGRA
jgi:hypothetical protein